MKIYTETKRDNFSKSQSGRERRSERLATIARKRAFLEL